MQITQQLNVISEKRGNLVQSTVDYSQTQFATGMALFDWNNQGPARKMRSVAGAWIDNSRNPNSIVILNSFSNQRIQIYGGEVCTIPIFAQDYPQISTQCLFDVTLNAGVTQFIFTDFDLGFNIAQTGSGSSIMVADNALKAFAGNWNYTTATTTGAAKVQLIPGLAATRAWTVQNSPASTGVGYVALGIANTPSATNGIVLAPGQILTSGQFTGTFQGVINIAGPAGQAVFLGGYI